MIFCADPKMAGHDGAIWADDQFAKFKLYLIDVHHTWVYQAQIGFAPEFFTVILHRLLNLHAQGCAWVVVKPKEPGVHVSCLSSIDSGEPEFEQLIPLAQGKFIAGGEMIELAISRQGYGIFGIFH